MEYLSEPNLPVRAVKYCVVSSKADRAAEALASLGIEAIRLAPCMHLAGPVADHPDMLFSYMGQGRGVVCGCCGQAVEQLRRSGLSVVVSTKRHAASYPDDIPLNCLIHGGKLYCRAASAAPEITAEYAGSIADVSQGYARCSVAVCGRDLAMTSDAGLAAALESNGTNVLLLPAGDIELPGYDTGFIGGCCGLINKDLLAFTGSLDRYACGEAVKHFLTEHGVRWINLSDTGLRDFGGIIPIAY